MKKQEFIENAQKLITKRGDNFTQYSLLAYFLFGLLISFFYGTHTIGFGVGLGILGFYFSSKFLFKKTTIYQYIGSLGLSIFMAQFIYQMHGMFEMHFFAFISALVLMSFENWKIQIPNFLFIIIHHSTFAYLQYSGNENIYFTQLESMDLTTFLFHAGLAAIVIVLASWWSYVSQTQTTKSLNNEFEITRQLEHLEKNIVFADNISQGKLDEKYDLTEGDKMGHSLLQMKNSLAEAKKREDQENYVNIGLTKLGDLLRANMDNVTSLSTAILSPLIKYLDANQGGIFILNDDDEKRPQLEMTAAYAYERKKYINKKLDVNEGLVGTCFLEQETIYMTDIPEQYVNITSGIGEAPPTTLIILPLKSNGEVVGVLEIASFKVLTEAQKVFLERLSENIGATIISTRNNEKTANLYEESQKQAEALQAQEEEMRQNMEELQATQEELQRQTLKSDNKLKAIHESGIATIEFTPEGVILDANKIFCSVMKYSVDEIKGKHHRIFVDPEYAKTEDYEQFWIDLANGVSKSGIYHRFDKDHKRTILNGVYTPIINASGSVQSILKFVVNVTENYDKIELLEKQLEALEV